MSPKISNKTLKQSETIKTLENFYEDLKNFWIEAMQYLK